MEQRIGRMQELVRGVREVRNRYKVDPKTSSGCVRALLRAAVAADFRALAPFIRMLAGVGKLECGPDVDEADASRRRTSSPISRRMCRWQGLIDVAAERQAAGEAAAPRRRSTCRRTQAKLDNSNFVEQGAGGGGAAAARARGPS